ncbi:tripartite tricarboxylate transporter substrate binding protein [Siccirubricoccus sp. KC 17139]|uniref:Tripartite tricarboxylate transporter substrate binding protein n=1 Tax=Siccirubricoccus soli TaxID=2899147 RepID=A0ABT1DCP3_9PROT|nr:tripartite tricarboxylate transporter substrate binding protein [Siccirubricoccus soli]MCO6419705.1 tripartite tricarboxylate transporter substrate binding protein [Siccirubricoccus soli]MCP2685840.1 tripartite tricarboxylate transporter substrate binding protein [Siccirubricoccus soli]
MPQRLAALLLALLLAAPVAAQEAPWPNRPITILGGFPNGSGVDIYARKLAEPLTRALGQPVVVDNRTGAGGNIASDHVAKARPDGYLFLLGTAGTHAINAALYRNLPFDPMRDVTHVALLGDVPNVLLVNPEKRPQYRNCQDVVTAARARPGQLNYASTGNGASTHLAGAQFAAALGIELTHVPYRGQPGAMQALLSGDVDLFFNQSGPSIGPVRQGQLLALGVSMAQPVPALPGVPTLAAACNLPGFESSTWYGLLAPPGLPAPILTRMHAEVAKILAQPEFRAWLVENQGISPPADTSPEAFRRVHAADIARWGEIVRKSGASVD